MGKLGSTSPPPIQETGSWGSSSPTPPPPMEKNSSWGSWLPYAFSRQTCTLPASPCSSVCLPRILFGSRRGVRLRAGACTPQRCARVFTAAAALLRARDWRVRPWSRRTALAETGLRASIIRRAVPRREPAPYLAGPRCAFVCVCVCLRVYSRVGASCVGRPICVCRVGTGPSGA